MGFRGEAVHTISLGDTGAFNASDISCTFALTLPFLVRIVLKASPRLFCLLCFLPPVLCSFVHEVPCIKLSLRGGHLSMDGGILANPFPLVFDW